MGFIICVLVGCEGCILITELAVLMVISDLIISCNFVWTKVRVKIGLIFMGFIICVLVGCLEMYIDNNITYKISCFNGMTKPILFKYFFLDFFFWFFFFSILLICTDYYVRKILCKKICGRFYLYIFFFVGSLVKLTLLYRYQRWIIERKDIKSLI